MDRQQASGGVQKFWLWLMQKTNKKNPAGIEMGCGKGRNSIWLSGQGAKMVAFDFSQNAIREAKKRAHLGVDVKFLVHDASKKWPFESNSFDFAVDCFASMDIESPDARSFARDEFRRTLKKGGILLVYTLSTDDEFHKEMVKKSPAAEKNSFIHPTGKFEKIFDRKELLDFYKDFKLLEVERIEKDEEFFGKTYHCKHFWII